MTVKARIFQPAKTAMQSGRGGLKKWRLEYAPVSAKSVEPLMGWTSSSDTMNQVAIDFDSKESAIAFCQKHQIDYDLFEPKKRKLNIKVYADNFSYSRIRG